MRTVLLVLVAIGSGCRSDCSPNARPRVDIGTGERAYIPLDEADPTSVAAGWMSVCRKVRWAIPRWGTSILALAESFTRILLGSTRRSRTVNWQRIPF